MSFPTKRNVSYTVFCYLIEVKITADEYTKESHVIKITLNRKNYREMDSQVNDLSLL